MKTYIKNPFFLPTILVVLALAPSSAPAGIFFTNEAAFVAAIQPNYYLESFDGWTYGSPLGGTNITDISTNRYTAVGSQGFGWTASATHILFSLDGFLSTGSPNDPLTITFTNNTVTAIGGIVANTDTPGNLIAGIVSIITSDGGSNSIVFATAAPGFLGYISTVPITSITFSATNSPTDDYVAVGHFYTGIAYSGSPPQLNILRSGANVLLTWPTNAAGLTFTLQSTTNLVSPATWSNVSPAPVVLSGQNTVTNPISGAQQFYRLSQ